MLVDLIGFFVVNCSSVGIISRVGVWSHVTQLVSSNLSISMADDCSTSAATISSQHLLAFILPINKLWKVLLNPHISWVNLIPKFNTGRLWDVRWFGVLSYCERQVIFMVDPSLCIFVRAMAINLILILFIDICELILLLINPKLASSCLWFDNLRLFHWWYVGACTSVDGVSIFHCFTCGVGFGLG